MHGSLALFQKRRRWALIVLLLAVSPPLLFVRSRLGEHAHEALEFVGMLAIAASIVGRLWCIMYIGGRKSAVVVDAGPYSLTRNPLYLFSIVAAAGMGAQSGSILVGAAFCLVALAVLRLAIGREERHLEESFGETYLDYKRRVPRIVPCVAGFRDARLLQVKPRIFYATVRDASAFLLAIPAFELI